MCGSQSPPPGRELLISANSCPASFSPLLAQPTLSFSPLLESATQAAAPMLGRIAPAHTGPPSVFPHCSHEMPHCRRRSSQLGWGLKNTEGKGTVAFQPMRRRRRPRRGRASPTSHQSAQILPSLISYLVSYRYSYPVGGAGFGRGRSKYWEVHQGEKTDNGRAWLCLSCPCHWMIRLLLSTSAVAAKGRTRTEHEKDLFAFRLFLFLKN